MDAEAPSALLFLEAIPILNEVGLFPLTHGFTLSLQIIVPSFYIKLLARKNMFALYRDL